MATSKRITLAILVGITLFFLISFGVLADGPDQVILLTELDIGGGTITSTFRMVDRSGSTLFEEQFPPAPGISVLAAQVQSGDLYYYHGGQFHRAEWPIAGTISNTKSFSAVGYPAIDLHDFDLSNDGTKAAHAIYDNIITDTTVYGGYVTGTVINNIIQIIDTEGNSLIAERDLSLTLPISGTNQSYDTTGPVRTYHVNSLDFSPDDSLLMLNLKHYGLLVLDATSSDLPTVAFLGIDEHQEHHDMRWHYLISDSVYLVSGFSNNPSGVSAGVVYHFDVVAGELTEQYRCDNADGFTSHIMGSTDYFPASGEMVVGWGAGVDVNGVVSPPPNAYTIFDGGCNVTDQGPGGIVSYWARVADTDIELYQYYFPLMFGNGGISVE